MKSSRILSVILFILLIPMLLRADSVTTGARNGLLLWYNSVVPALFPFMVLSGLIVSGGGVHTIMKPFFHVLNPLFSLSENGCYVLVSGLLCGYPMGAKTCAEFVRDGRIRYKEGQFLMAVCNHPSPMFLLGYVYPLFSSYIKVWELLICIYAPVLLLAFAAKCIYMAKTEKTFAPSSITAHTHGSAKSLTMDETILSSVEVLCKIGGYLVLFSIMIEFLQPLSIIPKPLKLTAIGILEMTTGIRYFVSNAPKSLAWIASIAALAFGGMSGLFQTRAVLNVLCNEKKAGLSIRPYLFWKLAHAALSAGLSYLLCIIR